MVLSLLYKKIVWICLSPTFLYIKTWIYLSVRWLNAVLVLLEMEMFVFFIALRSIAGWYIFSFYYCLVLNQYHSFVSFNHNYSDTWLSSRIDIMCFYHLRVVFLPLQSKSRNISFTVSHIKTTSWFWLFFFLCLD